MAGDLAEIKADLDLESPIENLDQALEDIAESVAEIAAVTRGFEKKEEPPKKKPAPKGPRRPQGGRASGAGQEKACLLTHQTSRITGTPIDAVRRKKP